MKQDYFDWGPLHALRYKVGPVFSYTFKLKNVTYDSEHRGDLSPSISQILLQNSYHCLRHKTQHQMILLLTQKKLI